MRIVWTKNLISKAEPVNNVEKDGIIILLQTLNKEPLTSNEEDLIFKYHINEGKKWAEIAKRLGKRTDNIVKNHFYATLRRYTRRVNKIMKNDAFKAIAENSLEKISTDFIYKCLIDGRIKYEELKTVDTDWWQELHNHFLKNFNKNSKNYRELENLKAELHLKVKQRIVNNSNKEICLNSSENRTISKRSSRHSGKKKGGNLEIENFNFFMLLEILNDNQSQKSISTVLGNAKSSNIIGKILEENSKEEKKIIKEKSKAISINSFRNIRKTSSKLQNKKLDTILNNIGQEDDDWDRDSLDLNIGKKIKARSAGAGNKIEAKREKKGLSNVTTI